MRKPFATLMVNLFHSVFITSKAIYDKYGPKVADRKYPIGAGSYKLKQITLGGREVLEKVPGHPDVRSDMCGRRRGYLSLSLLSADNPWPTNGGQLDP